MQASRLRVQDFVKFFLAIVFAIVAADRAEAATILCPNNTAVTYLEVEYTVGTITCADWEDNPGGVTGWESDGPDFPNNSDDPLTYNGVDYPLLDGDIPGEDAFSGSLLGDIGDYLVLFKFGGGVNTPDWFILFVDNGNSLTWEVHNAQNGLSHVSVWGDPGDPPQIPEPATLLMFGTGLLGAAAARRRASKV